MSEAGFNAEDAESAEAALGKKFTAENAESAQKMARRVQHWPVVLVAFIGLVAAPSGATAQSCEPGWLEWPVGSGPDATLRAFAEWDPDGAGPEEPVLVLAGDVFHVGDLVSQRLATWNGAEFAPFANGVNLPVLSATVFDADGGGPLPADLIVGGLLTQAGGQPASHIARWDGTSWHAMGAGVDGDVRSIVVHDGNLLVGGMFKNVGGRPSPWLGVWDGAQWKAFPQNPSSGPHAMVRYEGQLFLGGIFSPYGGPSRGVMRWAGTNWDVLTDGPTEPVYGLCESDGKLYATGYFSKCGNGEQTRGIAVYDGVTWKPVGGGLGPSAVGRKVASFDPDGAGPCQELLVVTGSDVVGEEPTGLFAVWDGTSWIKAFPAPNTVGLALAVYHDTLVLGGQFVLVNEKSSPYFALWGCEQSCPADCDQSGSLDVDDFICFQTLFGSNDLAADCDESGSLDIDDFICFQTMFGVGCP